MSYGQRIRSFMAGIGMLLAVLILLLAKNNGVSLIVLILAFSLILRGVRSLIYYLSMARFMVGGLTSFFAGVFLIDFGIVSISLADEARIYIFLYLAGWNAFSGLISLLRAWEAFRNKGRSWIMNALYGIVNIAILVCCFIYWNNPATLASLYCAGLAYSGILKIINAFRRTEIVYIQ